MKIFLTAKHWQLFSLMFGLPILLELIAFWQLAENRNVRALFYVIPIIMFLYMVTFFGWFWSIGINLHPMLPPSVHMNLLIFKLLLLFPILYISLFSFFFYQSFNSHTLAINPKAFALIIPIHLFSMFCLIYSLYFISKELKSVELQRPVTFSQYAGEFFLIWFFAIGVWFIQPRINKMFGKGVHLNIFEDSII